MRELFLLLRIFSFSVYENHFLCCLHCMYQIMYTYKNYTRLANLGISRTAIPANEQYADKVLDRNWIL